MKLTEKQKRFADYYVETGNATESARQAGYKQPHVQGSQNLEKPSVRAYIDKRLKELADKRIMGAQEALETLTLIARGEMEEEVVLSTPQGVERTRKAADINQRQKAIDSLLKRYPINPMDEARTEKTKAEIEFIKERTKLIKGEKKDTSLLEALIKTVNEDD
jgi:phage terminase small subunit